MSDDYSVNDVLVVDDNLEAAKDYARLITAKTGLKVVHTDDVDEALELCKTNAFKVLVLDQRMPKLSGTVLYGKIKEFDTNAHAIMLTGEASRSEIGAALGLGFKAYVPKNNIQELPQQVLHEYVAYQIATASVALSNARTPIFVRRTGRFARDTVTYRLLGSQLLESTYIFEKDWQNVATIHAGQSETTKVAVSENRSVRFEQETTSRLTSEFGLSVKQINTLGIKLGSELSTRFTSTTTIERSITAETTRTFSLPQEPGDPNALHVRLRRIEEAPAYARTRVELTTACTCCGSNNILVFEALVPTGRTSVRHSDVLSDGTKRVYQIS